MKSKTRTGKVLLSFLLSGGLVLAASCVKDADYSIDKLDKVDTSMNLFGSGVELPLGHSEVIKLDSLLNMGGKEALDDILKKDADGDFSISADGDYDLDEVISDLHLEKLGDINGTSFSTSVEYKIGDIKSEQFKMEGQNVSYESQLIDFSLSDIPMPTFSADEQVKAGMDKYLPESLDIGSKFGTMEYPTDYLFVDDLSRLIPASIPGDMEISVQPFLQQLNKTVISLNYSKQVDDSLALGENASKIQDIDNFTLSSGGTLKVSISVDNCPFTKGTVTPQDLYMDVSSMFDIDPVDLSSLVLSDSNGWKAEKTVSLSALAENFPEYNSGRLMIKGFFGIAGDMCITDAKSTPNTVRNLENETVLVKAVISVNGVTLKEMDITLGTGVSSSIPDVDMPVNISYGLPDAVSSVDTVFFKEDKKMSLSISATNLSSLKTADGEGHISVKPYVEITFPKGMEVKEAVDGKVVIKGEDLYSGDIDRQFTLVSMTPSNSGGSLSFTGNVTAKVRADVSGSFSSSGLPKSSSEDVTVKAQISCNPEIRDYKVTLDRSKLTKDISESKDFSFKLDGLDDFGSFRIGLKNSPKVLISFDLPETTELDIVAKNLVIALPSMMVVDGSAYDFFDPVKNTLTLDGKLPASIELPIEHLAVTPTKDESGQTVVSGKFSTTGSVTISNDRITSRTCDELKGGKMKFTASIPSMEAESITLDGDFNKSLDYEQKDIVILDKETLKDLPEEVKSIQELDFDEVNAIIEIELEGLPEMADGSFSLKNTVIHLPSFLRGENDSDSLVLDADIAVKDGQTIVQKAQLTKIKDVQLEGVSEIKGDVKLTSSLYCKSPSIDISSLKSTVKATVRIGVGNGSAAAHPGKIAISKAVVRAGYDMEDATTLALGDMPAELQAEDVNLALNPQMHLSLATNFGAPVSGNFILTPYVAGKPLEAVTVSGIELPYSEDAGKTIVNRYAIGAEVTASEDETRILTDLSPLLRRVPDSIVVAMKVNIDKEKDCIVYPSAKYTCKMGYSFNVPINFGDDFNLKLNFDVDAGGDIGSYIKMASGKVSLKGTYSTTLPVGADCSVSFLDKNDKEIQLTEPVTLKLAPSAGAVVKDDFALPVYFKDPDNAGVAKIRFSLAVLTSSGVSLNGDQYIKLDDLAIQLPSGITIEK